MEKIKDTLPMEKIQQAMGMGKELAKDFVQSKFDSSPTGERDKGRKNIGIVYTGGGKLEVQDTGYPTFRSPKDQTQIDHGVILKTIASALCGSDRHAVHGRHMDSKNLVIGHEITGEVVEKGPAVRKLEIGDIVSVPFNIGCGTCEQCVHAFPNFCSETNKLGLPGSIYGYPYYGGYQGGLAQFTMVPYADFNCLKIPQIYMSKLWDKILDVALITDVLATAYNAVAEGHVRLGDTVCICGAGPIGIASAEICRLMGAAEIFLCDIHPEKLVRAQKHLKCQIIDLSSVDSKKALDQIKEVLGCPEVDCGIDAVGFEAKKTGKKGGKENPSEVLNFLAEVVRPGGLISVPGVYAAPDPKGSGLSAKQGFYSIGFANIWVKGIKIIGTGQCPVKQFNLKLLKAIMHGRLKVSDLLNIQVINLEDLPKAYEEFDKALPVKWIVDTNGYLKQHCDSLLRYRKSQMTSETEVEIQPSTTTKSS
jgi:glutathione-independent formaldehyde dehydrogenase